MIFRLRDLSFKSTSYLPGSLAFDSRPSEFLTYFLSQFVPEDFTLLFSRLLDLIFKSTWEEGEARMDKGQGGEGNA
jgi:hypothetical protein